MIAVFGAFVLSGDRIIAMFGIGLAAAVALDAFVLRTLLVPALMHMLGSANWWLPRWMERWLPRISIEPEAIPEPEPLGPEPRPESVPESVPATAYGAASETAPDPVGAGLGGTLPAPRDGLSSDSQKRPLR
jgi:RND superfamily putative drug exporter